MGFLDNYEGNKERTDRWIATYPEGRLEAHIIEFNAEKGYILIQAKAWRNQSEVEPAGIDYAYGYLAAYNANMKRWMIEDTSTSALMRVMALVMGGSEKATKETMQQVETMSTKAAESVAVDYDAWTTTQPIKNMLEVISEQLGGELIPGAPICLHGHRVWREGDKNGKAWGGYMCIEKIKASQCSPMWYAIGNDGKWKPQA
ncbi:hypothetical protein UFOVP874_2 [uncultured Caudovirales phage]|uniref:Uncharacterized protein n=1 Tax=uncultured Caudovirales phage TaxID=2100421 RepID=A0A6J5PGB4_9CAUD|nr:hypothetical protein UFOVP874_2 [uncultured Caudovirales phage]